MQKIAPRFKFLITIRINEIGEDLTLIKINNIDQHVSLSNSMLLGLSFCSQRSDKVDCSIFAWPIFSGIFGIFYQHSLNFDVSIIYLNLMVYIYFELKAIHTRTYSMKIPVICCSKCFDKARTKSQAALLLVSKSEPSISLRIYSSALSSKSSSSVSVTSNKNDYLLHLVCKKTTSSIVQRHKTKRTKH